jgi:hypothetical protein
MTRKPKDWAALLDAELQRFGMPLATSKAELNGRVVELPDRTLVTVLRHIILPERPNGYWAWGGRCNSDGYGKFNTSLGGRIYDFRAHRLAYQILLDTIPDGLTLDHLCCVKHCVNPAHLDPCTRGENIRRAENAAATINRKKTACPQGHPYDLVRKGRNGRVRRDCRTCERDSSRRRRAARRVEAGAAA